MSPVKFMTRIWQVFVVWQGSGSTRRVYQGPTLTGATISDAPALRVRRNSAKTDDVAAGRRCPIAAIRTASGVRYSRW
jgi:hypothetical protein